MESARWTPDGRVLGPVVEGPEMVRRVVAVTAVRALARSGLGPGERAAWVEGLRTLILAGLEAAETGRTRRVA